MTQERPAIAVTVVDDQLLLRDAITTVLNAAGFEAHSEPSLSALLATNTRPDVAVIGIDASSDTVMSLLDELPRVTACCRALILTSGHDTGLHANVIELGAMGILTREDSADVLVKAVEKVHAGELWLDRMRTARVVARLARGRNDEDPDQARIASLTPREREIVQIVTEGLHNAEIAERLFISEATVRNHLTSILDKLDLSDRFQLAVYSFRRGLVRCPQASRMLLLQAQTHAPGGEQAKRKGRH